MYKAHSKDINRNKSFHPLTFGNLSKVEKLKEKEAAKKEEQAKRQQELARDQEERRYNELVNAGIGADAAGGGAVGLLPVKRVFAAEYEKEELAVSVIEVEKAGAPDTPSAHHQQRQDAKHSGFMLKFKREPAQREGGDAGNNSNNDDSTSHAKRERDDADDAEGDRLVKAPRRDAKETAEGMTGYVTTSEAARLRKEYELLKKQKVDPLRKVQEYQNKTVAAAAKQKHQSTANNGGSASPSEESAIRDRVRKMMEMSKRK